jgi:hypothetical protein
MRSSTRSPSGTPRGFGFAPAFYEELRQGGIELDRSVFGRQEE